MATEHDFSGLPATLSPTDGAERRRGLIATIIVIFLGLALMVLGPLFSATGSEQADVVAESAGGSADPALATDSLGPFLQQLGDAISTAGAVMLAGGLLMLVWLTSRPSGDRS